jgi:cytochrome P450
MPSAVFPLASAEARRNPFPRYADLRGNPGIVEASNFGWMLTRYEDAVFVLNHPGLFSSSVMAEADASLLGNDPPGHTRVRGIVNPGFSAKRIQEMEPSVWAAADQLLSRVQGAKDWNLVSDLAAPLPLVVIAGMLGIHTRRMGDLKRWSSAIVARHTGSAAAKMEAAESIREADRFFEGWLNGKCPDAEDSILGRLLRGQMETGRLVGRELLSLVRILLVGGNETTTNLIGNTVLALLRHPAVLAKVRADLSLIPACIEETLRFEAPVQFVARRAAQEVKLAGTKVPAGARVVVLLGSANRDPSRFADADRFDLTRKPRGHLAFGAGIHACPGAGLARLEARIAIERLLVMGNFRFEGNLEQVPLVDSVQLRGPKELRLRWEEA